MAVLVVYVPQGHEEAVKQAIFAAGGGRQGNYSQCCWQVLGTGQFCPLEGAVPAIGYIGKIEQVKEWRIECMVMTCYQQAVEEAMLAAHPYETVAYHWIGIIE